MHVRTLGGLALEESSFERQKPLLLLTYLVLEGPKHRREVADLFWPNGADARDSLSTTVRRLNAAHADLITADRTTLRANATCDALDLLHADVGEPEAIVSAYTGLFLADLDLPLGEELAEWVYGTRERIAEKVRQAHLELAERRGRAHDRAAAAHEAGRALDVPGAAPPDERTLRRIAKFAAGDVGLSRRVLELASGFGLELDAEVAPGIPSNLPALVTSFVGRDALLAQISSLLNTRHARLLTLHGAGGVGKSRLAVEAARSELDTSSFPDGVLFVPLEEIAGPEEFPSAVAASLGSLLMPDFDPVEQLLALIGDKHLLLVLDNAEHLADHGDLFGSIVRRCPNARLIVTSRQLLNLGEEHVIPIGGLPPGSSSEEGTATRLLWERVVQRGATPGPFSESQEERAQRICALVEGFPLAIELAAAWTRVMSHAEIALAIERDVDLLSSRDPAAQDRHRSLRAAFETSWRLLSPRERAGLRRLAVFRGGFTRSAAEDVAGVDLTTINNLIDKSLVRRGSGGRFERHPLIHQFTEEKLRMDPYEDRRYRTCHASHFVEVLQSAEDGILGGSHSTSTVRELDQELPNIQHAWSWAVDHLDPRRLRRACFVLGHYGERQGNYALKANLLTQLVERLEATQEDEETLLGALAARSLLYFRLGETAKAIATGSRAYEKLEGFRRETDNWAMWIALHGAGDACIMEGRLDEAEAHIATALRIAEADARSARTPLDVKRGEVSAGTSHLVLGIVAVQRGNLDGARRELLAAETVYRKHDSPYLTYVLWQLGQLSLAMGDPRRAKDQLRQALTHSERTEFKTQTAFIRVDLARAVFETGDLKGAQDLCRTGLRDADAIRDGWLRTNLYTLLGRLSAAERHHAEALVHYRAAFSNAVKRSVLGFGMEALLRASDVLILEGEVERAAAMLRFVVDHESTTPPLRKGATEALERLPDEVPLNRGEGLSVDELLSVLDTVVP